MIECCSGPFKYYVRSTLLSEEVRKVPWVASRLCRGQIQFSTRSRDESLNHPVLVSGMHAEIIYRRKISAVERVLSCRATPGGRLPCVLVYAR